MTIEDTIQTAVYNRLIGAIGTTSGITYTKVAEGVLNAVVEELNLTPLSIQISYPDATLLTELQNCGRYTLTTYIDIYECDPLNNARTLDINTLAESVLGALNGYSLGSNITDSRIQSMKKIGSLKSDKWISHIQLVFTNTALLAATVT